MLNLFIIIETEKKRDYLQQMMKKSLYIINIKTIRA